ncbi:hypothetical protein PUN28_003169 [Cardiocondyla obscurior]|uniref:Uncharacterized protein n=1 Tax=Cardiocondyla obscurior TaxID=286306 RepID=A0AAW2GHI3_9HYME
MSERRVQLRRRRFLLRLAALKSRRVCAYNTPAPSSALRAHGKARIVPTRELDEQIQQIAELRDIDRNPLREFEAHGNVVLA